MQPARILVIEDNALDIVLLRHALDKQGEAYELEILSNGEDALRFVHEHRTRVREPEPCVILLDLYLPVYDGMAVLRAIRDFAIFKVQPDSDDPQAAYAGLFDESWKLH